MQATGKENDINEVYNDAQLKESLSVGEHVRKPNDIDSAAVLASLSNKTSDNKTEIENNAKTRTKRAKSLSGPAVQSKAAFLGNRQGEQSQIIVQPNQYDQQIISTTHQRRHSGSSVMRCTTDINTVLPYQNQQPQLEQVMPSNANNAVLQAAIPYQQNIISNDAPMSSGYTSTTTEQAYSQSVCSAQFSSSSFPFSQSTSNLPKEDLDVSVPIINGSSSVNTSERNITISSTQCSISSATVSLASSNHVVERNLTLNSTHCTSSATVSLTSSNPVVAQPRKAPSPILDASLLSEDELLCALQRKFSITITDSEYFILLA